MLRSIDIKARELDLDLACSRERDRTEGGLNGELVWIAHRLVQATGVGAVAVLAYDQEKQLLGLGLAGAPVPLTAEAITAAAKILNAESIGTPPCWRPIPSTALEFQRAGCDFLCLPLVFDTGLFSAILVKGDDDDVLHRALETIRRCSATIALAIQTARARDTRRRIRDLSDLASHEFGKNSPNLQQLVHSLAFLFRADVVSLWLEQAELLRLEATTDLVLRERNPLPTYTPHQGLTGHVFATGTALRLSDAGTQTDVRQRTGIERTRPTHPERAMDGSTTVRYLAVPIRHRGKVEGVLRMSRSRSIPSFTDEEEDACQFFADLLGLALARARDLWLINSILDSESVALVVSRRTIEGGRVVPRVVQANAGAERLYHLSRRELIGTDARTLFDPDEYQALQPALRTATRRALDHGHSEYVATLKNVRRSDGTTEAVQLFSRIIADTGFTPPVLYTIGLALVITELEAKRSQLERLLQVMEEFGIAYFRADNEGTTVESSPAESRITGYSPEELLGLARRQLYHSDEHLHHMQERLESGDGRLVISRQRLLRKDSTTFWAEGEMRVVRNASGRRIGFEGFYRDVSDRVRLEEFVDAPTDGLLDHTDLYEKLKEHESFNLDYVSSVGHQLLTPLSSLVENLGALARSTENAARVTARLPYLVGQATVCMRLVRNLSYMDRILRGTQFKRTRVSLGQLAVETKLNFSHLLAQRRLDIDVDDKSLDRHVPVLGEPELLRQVLVNLVDNAIKYSFPDTVILIRGCRLPEGRALEITNRGLRVPEREREQIFKRGYRTRKAQMLAPYSTGLGLWLVRRIVEAHGATVRCSESCEDSGNSTVFRVLFPFPIAAIAGEKHERQTHSARRRRPTG